MPVDLDASLLCHFWYEISFYKSFLLHSAVFQNDMYLFLGNVLVNRNVLADTVSQYFTEDKMHSCQKILDGQFLEEN